MNVKKELEVLEYMCAQDQTKVLIVDDEADVRFLFGRIFSKRNIETSYANSLEEAEVTLRKERPSMVFLDNNLPDGQGIDFIPFLKSNYPEIRIVMVTANDSPQDQKKAYQHGADYFLTKPLNLAQIHNTFDKVSAGTLY